MNTKLTKTEQMLIEQVGRANQLNATAGIIEKHKKFADRLITKGILVYLEWTPAYGAGYILAENVNNFK